MPGKQMAFTFFSLPSGHDLNIVLHTAEPPPVAEWNAYVAAVRQRSGRFAPTTALVISDGGGPSAPQRKELSEVFQGGQGIATAFITSNHVLRGIVTAISWVNPKIRSFTPDDMEKAFEHVGVEESETGSIWAEISRLEMQLDKKLLIVKPPKP